MDAPAELFNHSHAGMFGTIAVLENSAGGGGIGETGDGNNTPSERSMGEVITAGGGAIPTPCRSSTNKYFPEAPNDGKQYARQSEDGARSSLLVADGAPETASLPAPMRAEL